MSGLQIGRSPNGWVRLLGILQWMMACGIVQAGSYGINPVKLTLSAQNATQIITVRNDGEQASVMQVELSAWSQSNGNDVHTPTRELLATPPIFTLLPGASQIIRIGLRSAPDTQRELSYRMFLQEVPPPAKPDVVGLQVALRFSVPVFVTPAQAVKPDLHWQAVRLDEHTLKVGVTNIGNSHDHLSAYKIYRSGNSNPIIAQKLFAYLLPGETRYWSLTTDTLPNSGEHLSVLANTEMGEVIADVVIDKP